MTTASAPTSWPIALIASQLTAWLSYDDIMARSFGIRQSKTILARFLRARVWPNDLGIADAHRGDGKRYVVRADEKLTAFVELQKAIHEFAVSLTL